MGYRFSPTFVTNLLSKYDPKTKRLTLDHFIVASVQIKRLTGKLNISILVFGGNFLNICYVQSEASADA